MSTETIWSEAYMQVRQKWRNIVMASPRRLNLQLIYIATKPVREKLNIWLPLSGIRGGL